ncbi:MAG TPA: EpsI family protein, partial [Allosphingosinicella sp.]|nr:EpsI family protein [Allosphingosinicella sp.]
AAGDRPVPPEIAIPEIPGWRRVPPAADWRPHYTGADRLAVARYRDGRGEAVDLAIAVYARQSEGRELVGFGQGAAAPGGAWAWTADAPAPPNGRAERIASHGVEREVVSFYRVGTILTGSGVGVKLETMKVRLLGGPQRAVAILISSDSRAAIDDFIAQLGPIDRLADGAAGLR